MLEVTLGSITGTSATVVEISDDCVRYDIGTTGTIVHIMAEDHYEEVCATGTIAHIKFRPYMSSSYAMGYGNTAQIPNDSEINFTMKDVTDLSPILTHNMGWPLSDLNVSIAFSANIIWEMYEYSDECILNRWNFHCTDLSYNGYTLSTSSRPYLVLVSDYTAFFLYYDNVDEYHLSRLDAPYSGYGGGIPVKTELDTWNSVVGSRTAGNGGWMVRVKYNTTDKLVIAIPYSDVDDGSDMPEVRIIIWDLNTTTVSLDNSYTCSNTADLKEFGGVNYPLSQPGIYQDKLVFSANIIAQETPANPGEIVFCPCPTYVVNCSTDSVTSYFNYSHDYYYTDYNLIRTVAMDQATGIHYMWLDDDDMNLDALLKVDLAGGGIQLIAADIDPAMGEFHLLQGEDHAYVVKGVDADADTGSIRRADNWTSILCSFPRLDTDTTKRDDCYHVVMDDRNDRCWVMNNNTLLGKSLSGGEDVTIDVNWSGGNIPYTYTHIAEPQCMSILCGNIIYCVQSYETYVTPPLYKSQKDYYILAHV